MKKVLFGTLVLVLILIGIAGCSSKTQVLTPAGTTSLVHSYGLDSTGMGKNGVATPAFPPSTTTRAMPAVHPH